MHDEGADGADVSEDAVRIAELLRSNPALCAKVATSVASVDPRTAARLALTFSRAIQSYSGADKTSVDGSAQPTAVGSRAQADIPNASQMWKLMIRTAVPFIGFGFFDNMIMLTVGETIDCTLGVAFGFSTLAAAGMGQMVSDASGITLQGLIERFADRLGLPDPKLTLAQQQMNVIKYWMIGARIFGIVFGCLLGMFPLIMMPERQPHLVDQIAEKLPAQNRAEFQRAVSTVHFKQGDKLVKYGEKSDKVFMIQSGHAEVIGRDLDGLPFMVCTIGPGHAFGIPELSKPSHVDLVAKDEEVIVQSIAKADFLRVVEEQEGIDVFLEARSAEHQVYLRSQGQSVAGTKLRAEKGTGKTRMFASLSQEDKLEILRLVGTEEALRFKGDQGEGKVNFFAKLSEDQKMNALAAWQQTRSEAPRAESVE